MAKITHMMVSSGRTDFGAFRCKKPPLETCCGRDIQPTHGCTEDPEQVTCSFCKKEIKEKLTQEKMRRILGGQ